MVPQNFRICFNEIRKRMTQLGMPADAVGLGILLAFTLKVQLNLDNWHTVVPEKP